MHSRQDQNLVFGLLAVHHQHISAIQLVEAANRWLSEVDSDLPAAVLKCGFMNQTQVERVEQAVQQFLDGSLQIDFSGELDDSPLFSSRKSTADDYQAEALFSSWQPIDEEHTQPIAERDKNLAGSYRFLQSLARGGLGKVSVANDSVLDREVAIKEVLPKYSNSIKAVHRFLHEARITGGLEHPGVVPVYAMGDRKGQPFYVMRLIRGDSLQDAIENLHGKPKVTQCFENLDRTELRRLIQCLGDACHTIAYAHSRGVLHRDVKPSNIMLGKYGETIVVDWGMAKSGGETTKSRDETTSEQETDEPKLPDAPNLTGGDLLGTPAFMSPEQANKRFEEINEKSDVFSLGATLFAILANHAPYVASSSREALELAQECQITRLRNSDSTIPKALQAIYLKAMSPEPADRYASPTELVEDLDLWMAGEPTKACPESIYEKASRWARNHQHYIAMVMGFLLLSIVGLITANRIISLERDSKNLALQEAQLARQDAEEALAEAEHQEQLAIDARDQADRRREKLYEVVDEFFLRISNYKMAEVGNNESERAEMITYALDVFRPLAEKSPDDPQIKANLIGMLEIASVLYSANRQEDLAVEVYEEQERRLQELLAMDLPMNEYAGRVSYSLTSIAYSQYCRFGELAAAADVRRALNFVEANRAHFTANDYAAIYIKANMLQTNVLLETKRLRLAQKLISDRQSYTSFVQYSHFPVFPAYWQYYLAGQQVMLYERSGQIDLAIVHATSALQKLDEDLKKLDQSIHLLSPRLRMQTRLAGLYFLQGDEEKAWELLNSAEVKAAQLLDEYPDNTTIASSLTLVNLTQAWVALGQSRWGVAGENASRVIEKLDWLRNDANTECIQEQKVRLVALAILSRVAETKKAEFEHQTRLEELLQSLVALNPKAHDVETAMQILSKEIKVSKDQ